MVLSSRSADLARQVFERNNQTADYEHRADGLILRRNLIVVTGFARPAQQRELFWYCGSRLKTRERECSMLVKLSRKYRKNSAFHAHIFARNKRLGRANEFLYSSGTKRIFSCRSRTILVGTFCCAVDCSLLGETKSI